MGRSNNFIFAVGLFLLFTSLTFAPADVRADAKLLNARCAACHERNAEDGLERVSDMRKTPEGWDMTIVRMMVVHGVKVTADERRALVKHLADTSGLAPSESAEWRYILERQPSAIESPPDSTLGEMCGRCHSYARVALQRRDTDEWVNLSHFHLGQYPSAEYQALGRDRNWWEIASTEVPQQLGELYPLETAAWSDWSARAKPDMSGAWRIVGRRPGHGSYQGLMTVKGSGDDAYKIDLSLTYDNGTQANGSGNAIVYTGYEWRASLKLGGETVRQVFALSEDGAELSGRWFLADTDSLGAMAVAVRTEGGGGRILSVAPTYLRRGDTATINIHGVGLGGQVSLGDGVEVVEVVSHTPQTVTVRAKAPDGIATGTRSVQAGDAKASGIFTVYDNIDSLRVEPAYTIARVGGAGGPLPSVPAQFDAVGYMNGPDGEPGTGDDIRIGVMPAEWSVANFDEAAQAMNDIKFAGLMQPGGLFVPAGAGLNPQRPFSTNNVGNLSVVAVVDDGASRVEGTGHLVVTVQRWIDPPIR